MKKLFTQSSMLIALVVLLTCSSCKNAKHLDEVAEFIGNVITKVLPQLERLDLIDYHLFALEEKGTRKLNWLSYYAGDGITVTYKQVQLLYLPVYNYDIRVFGQYQGRALASQHFKDEFEGRQVLRPLMSGWSLWIGKAIFTVICLIGFFVIRQEFS